MSSIHTPIRSTRTLSNTGFLTLSLCCFLLSTGAYAGSGEITLDQAKLIAIQNDLTLENYRDESRATRASAQASSALPPPVLGIKLANIPVDSFEFNQEPMSQAMISYAQKLPAKGLLASRKDTLLRTADIASAKIDLRARKLSKQFEKVWVMAWKAERVVEITERHRSHFEQMIASAEANYRAAVRRSSQRDVLTLNTALAQLDNRTQAAQTQFVIARESLREWLDGEQLNNLNFDSALEIKSEHRGTDIAGVDQHPAITVHNTAIERADAAIELAAARGRSGKAINVSYGYRDDAENGTSRSDFFSIGFSMELSSFRNSANDSRSAEARIKREKAQREKQLTELQLRSEYQSTVSINQSLELQMQTLESRLLPQSIQQADSARGAYASGEAGFMEIQRAQINLMQVELQTVELQAQILQNAATLNYLSPHTDATAELSQ